MEILKDYNFILFLYLIYSTHYHIFAIIIMPGKTVNSIFPTDRFFNIQAENAQYGTGLLKKDLHITRDTSLSLFDTLRFLGTIQLMLLDTFDTNNSYVFLKGTSKYEKISPIPNLDSNTFSVMFDSIPPAQFQTVHFLKMADPGNIISLVNKPFQVLSNDTILIHTNLHDTIHLRYY